MNAFHDLFQHRASPPAGQIYTDDRSVHFPEVVAHSARLTLWNEEDLRQSSGRLLLLGVATWSGYDMKLLDAIEQSQEGPDLIEVFDAADCKTKDDFERRIPGIGTAFQMPVVGYWENGKLVARGSGHEGREIAFRACGIDPQLIGELLDPHTVIA